MALLKKLWKMKQVKIGLAAVCVIAILAAALFLQAEPNTDTVYDASSLLETDSGSPSADSTPDASSDAVETVPDDPDPADEASSSADASDDPGETASPSSAQTSETSVAAGTDDYETDPVAEGNPTPVEPEDVTVDDNKQYTCTLSIRCDTILNNMNLFNADKLGVLPSDGTILGTVTATFSEGESVFDVLQRVTREKSIQMEYVFTPMYNSAYIEGIHNLYEFDCGSLSGWMYKVNGWFPNYGCSRYVLKDGDTIEWVYTCDLGKDVGGYYATGS